MSYIYKLHHIIVCIVLLNYGSIFRVEGCQANVLVHIWIANLRVTKVKKTSRLHGTSTVYLLDVQMLVFAFIGEVLLYV